MVVIFFHILDRQIEFTSRTDYLWKAKLKVEQEEVETMRGINKVTFSNYKCGKLFVFKTIKQILDSSRKHSTGSRGRTFPVDQSDCGPVPRTVFVRRRDVRLHTELQRILRRKRRE